jgi:hypothetical protein
VTPSFVDNDPVQLEHWVVVADEYEHDGDNIVIEHHPDCPVVEGHMGGYMQYDCPVAFEEYNCGLEMFFEHTDTPKEDRWYRAARLEPGRYQIEAWSETYRGPEGNEYESGLRLVED